MKADSISALNYIGILKQGSKDGTSRWVLLKLFPPLFAAQEVVRLSSPVENKSRAKEDDFLVGDAKGLSGKLCFVLQATKLQLCEIDHCARKKEIKFLQN